MTSPAAPTTTETSSSGFSAEDVTEDALTAAVTAAVAAWLAASTSLILAGGGVPNLSLMLDGSVYVTDAMRRVQEALERAWLTVYARTGHDLRPEIPSYMDGVRYRLDGLARLAWRRASTALAEAQGAFDDMDKLRDALREALMPSQYTGYINRVAQSEANISVNMARHAAAARAYAAGSKVEKTWVSRRDIKVRHTHKDADNGQLIPFVVPFTIGGWPMQHPGDPTAPASETANCRCTARYVISKGPR